MLNKNVHVSLGRQTSAIQRAFQRGTLWRTFVKFQSYVISFRRDQSHKTVYLIPISIKVCHKRHFYFPSNLKEKMIN